MIGFCIKKITGYKALLLGAIWLPVSCLAGSDQLDFTVKVRIELKTCDVNDNQTIEVEFGDMIIKNIDGVAYEQPIPYTLDCEDATNSTPLRLRFENNVGANFTKGGYRLLQTGERNLGLMVKQDGQPFSFDSWVPFIYGSEPRLSVVPVASGNDGLNDGEFDATALLTVEYE
ncbi:fimbrial protein [Providencia stuartii]|uniref:fimbrial protein n=1 Tax=Providencia TaxID=586 RepID=UPI00293F9409|nr:fimbrial protein [Providencia sp. 2023EL-00965]ELR5301621.1 fimbrial protein [Providencia stuartii]MDW7590089.1 fimbrial protein [Providencia sp. 2023EL-00965]